VSRDTATFLLLAHRSKCPCEPRETLWTGVVAYLSVPHIRYENDRFAFPVEHPLMARIDRPCSLGRESVSNAPAPTIRGRSNCASRGLEETANQPDQPSRKRIIFFTHLSPLETKLRALAHAVCTLYVRVLQIAAGVRLEIGLVGYFPFRRGAMSARFEG